MGKKTKKKNAQDSRGYSVTSVLKEKKEEQGHEKEDEDVSKKGQKKDHADEKAPLPPSKEQLDFERRQKRISAEILHLKSYLSTTKPYRGQLAAPHPLLIEEHFSLSGELVERIILNARYDWKNHSKCFRSSVWDYTRAQRVLHALVGAGFRPSVARDALLASSGKDERAAAEYALLHFSHHELPEGWYQETKPKSSDGSSNTSSEVIVGKDQSIELHKSKQDEHFDRLQRAKQLVSDIKRENDEAILNPDYDLISALIEKEGVYDQYQDISSTEVYGILKAQHSTLSWAKKILSDKHEKKVLSDRIRVLSFKMNELVPDVDFKLLKTLNKDASNEIYSKENSAHEVIEEQHDTLSNDSDSNVCGMDCLFGDEFSSSENVRTESSSAIFKCPSNANGTPRKIISQYFTEFHSFETVREREKNKWLVKVVLGPLSASSAKKFSLSQGSYFTTTPKQLSEDIESAKELACLEVLFAAVKDSSQRLSLSQKLCYEAREVWQLWILDEETEAEKEIREWATLNVECIETSISQYAESMINGDSTVAVERVAPESSRGVRKRLTRVQILRELDMRQEKGNMRFERIREDLPVVKEANRIAQIISTNDICMICGETGSGKSTQVPQIILRNAPIADFSNDEVLNIVVTQPRRVSAVSISKRVSEELGDDLGEDDWHKSALCGYSVRLDSRVGSKCVLEYVTIGVLLRRIQATHGGCLAQYSHVIVDEVHERSLDSDLLLILLKKYKSKFRNRVKKNEVTAELSTKFPRIVMMSATADVAVISRYWEDESFELYTDENAAENRALAVAHIPGRTFPVVAKFLDDIRDEYSFLFQPDDACTNETAISMMTDFERERNESLLLEENTLEVNYTLLIEVLKYELLHGESTGAVLIFMPGLEEIRRLIHAIEVDDQFPQKLSLVPMHSSLSNKDLHRAFEAPLPGYRKIVISTNICETGVTIEDVDLVIDTGLVKTMKWNEVTEISQLRLHRCSIAEALQRRGRAGRVRPGKCVHFFPRHFMESLESSPKMTRRPEPELQRAPLASTILALVDQGLEPSSLLSNPGNVLSSAKLESATRALLDIGAIVAASDREDDGHNEEDLLDTQDSLADASYSVTPLGVGLAALPCSPSSGMILIAAEKLGCLRAAAVFVASLDSKSVYLTSEQSSAFFRERFERNTKSDAAAIVNVYSEWYKASSKREWCRRHSVSHVSLTHLSKLVEDILRIMQKVMSGSVESSRRTGDATCSTCAHDAGMHTCVTGGSLECLLAAIACGAGRNLCFRRSSDPSSSSYLSNSKGSITSTIHSSSLVSKPGKWVIYYNQMKSQKSRRTLLHGVSSVSLVTVLLFISWKNAYLFDGSVVLGRGVGIKCRPQTLAALRVLRKKWESILIRNVLPPSRNDGQQSNGDDTKTDTASLELIKELIHMAKVG